MLPSYWKHDAIQLRSVSLLRLMPDSPAGAIVDLRKALVGFLRHVDAKTIIVDIREHDHRCPGTREAMAELTGAGAELGCRVIFVAEAIRGRHYSTVMHNLNAAIEAAK